MSVILGGGISGLSAAFYTLKHTSDSIILIESSKRLGGWVKSIQTPQGIIFEQGPRTIRPKGKPGANTLKLVEDLGLTKLIRPINSNHATAKNRLIYVDQKLHKLPSSLWSLFKTHTPFSKPLIYSLLHDLKTKSIKKQDESIYDFTSRRFGKEIADYAVSSMICGICAGDAKKISVNFLMAKLFEVEQKHGSVLKGMLKENFNAKKDKTIEQSDLYKRAQKEKWSVWSVEGGLQSIVDALNDKIKCNVDIKLNTTCTNIQFDKYNATLTLSDNKIIQAKHVISSLPAPKLGKLLQKQHPQLANDLSNIEHVNVAVVNLAYENTNLKENAFGFLVPPKENLPILGVIFDSCCFKQNDWTVLTVMMGGAWFDKYFNGISEKDILDVATKYVHEILHVPQIAHVSNVDILKECIPQYSLGHAQRVKDITEYIKKHQLPLHLTGSSYYGVGINDVILSSKNAIQNIKW